MKAVLKAFDCSDHDSIEVWRPRDADPVDYRLCCHIGPFGKEGADLFYVQVLSESAADAVVAAGKKIVVPRYTWAAVGARVEELISASEGEDWSAIARKLSQHFDWEFDDYVEFKERA